MRGPRLRILLPVALLLGLAMPAFRLPSWGMWIPDPWLLLLLAATPYPWDGRWRRTVLLVGSFGLLRASVSAVSPFVGWAGYAMGLVMRNQFQRYLSDHSFLARCTTGMAAALPLVLLDHAAALRYGAAPETAVSVARVVWVGLIWSVAWAPPAWRALERRA